MNPLVRQGCPPADPGVSPTFLRYAPCSLGDSPPPVPSLTASPPPIASETLIGGLPSQVQQQLNLLNN